MGPRAGKAERSWPNKAPATHSSSRGRTKGAFGAARSHAPPARARWAKCGHRRELPGRGGCPGWLAGPRPPLSAGPRARHAPGPPNAPSPAAPPDAPTSAGSQQWALPRRPPRPREGARLAAPGPGAQQPPPAHLPPTTRPQPGSGAAATWKIGLTFPEPARPRAPPSLCLWQTWFAEKRTPSLLAAAAAAATAPAAPELPPRSRPPPRRSLAHSLALSSPRSPPSPPGAGSALFPAVKASAPAAAPSPWNSSRAGSAWSAGAAAAAARPPARLPAGSLARPPARLRLHRPLRLLHRCRRRRRWSTWSSTERGYPGEGSRRASTSRD